MSDRRQALRLKCMKHASIICEEKDTGDETFMSIHVVDESGSGICIASNDPIDVTQFLKILIKEDGTEQHIPVDFMWMQRYDTLYLLGFKKIAAETG